ncbi:MAG: hypothetical protein WAO98_04465 [Alphaproteobacteria bacterium]
MSVQPDSDFHLFDAALDDRAPCPETSAAVAALAEDISTKVREKMPAHILSDAPLPAPRIRRDIGSIPTVGKLSNDDLSALGAGLADHAEALRAAASAACAARPPSIPKAPRRGALHDNAHVPTGGPLPTEYLGL